MMTSGSRPRGRRGNASRPAAWVALGLLLAGCASTQPLQPAHGYPADWPRLMPLSEGFAELSGVSANTGVATAGDGSFLSSHRLRFTVPYGSERRVFDVDATGKASFALYPLTGSGQSAIVGMAVSSTEIRLT